MPTWKKTCPTCGMSWESEHDSVRICPFCHVDLINGKMPGEDGYNGQHNYNNNEPRYSSGSGDGTPLVNPEAFSTIWGVLAVICLVVAFVALIINDGFNGFCGITTGLFVLFAIIHLIKKK